MKLFLIIGLLTTSCNRQTTSTIETAYGTCKWVGWPSSYTKGVAVCEDDLARCYIHSDGVSCVKKN